MSQSQFCATRSGVIKHYTVEKSRCQRQLPLVLKFVRGKSLT